MKKSDFYPIVARKAHLTKKTAKATVDTFLNEVIKALTKGEKVVLSGFGTLEIKTVKSKTVIPFGDVTKQTTVKSHHVVSFKPSKPLKKAIW